MKKIFSIRGKKTLRHGGVSLALCVLVIASVIIANTALSALAGAFGWYIDMREKLIFGVGDACESYLSDIVFPLMDKQSSQNDKIQIIFCDEARVLDDELASEYVYNTACELEKKFPDRIEVDFLNVWEDPSTARLYGVSNTSDVVVKFGDSTTALGLSQFYLAKDGDIENPSAYNAERRFSSAMLRVVSPTTPMCYFTSNHGESLGDYELMYLLADAGYSYAFVNLLEEDIPEDCSLLITANPTKDLFEMSAEGGASERAKLDAYMSAGGKYLTFVNYDTFGAGGFEHYESFLSDWGVQYMHKTGNDGVENPYTVNDVSNATQPDGYTFFSAYADNDIASGIFKNQTKKNLFSYATVIAPAEGFTASGESYARDGVKMTPLLCSYASAEAWSGGFVAEKAEDNPFILMSISEKACENGETASVVAATSSGFFEEDALQSQSYGNSDAILSILAYFGNENVPLNLSARPLSSPPIEALTTRAATIITLLLCAIPTLIIAAVGTVVIVRRRHT